MTQHMIEQARAVMGRNDRGTYTVPTHGLYPFQWNWDSALSALGFSHFDEARAWTEIETLFAHQWDDTMCINSKFIRILQTASVYYR